MKENLKLTVIKSLHTFIWVFYNIVIFYLFYAILMNKIDKWVWICIGLICFEGITLAINKFRCPLTLVAKKYSNSQEENFDIFLPNWLAKYNKTIYTTIFIISIIILILKTIKL